MGYSPWARNGVGHDFVTKQQQSKTNIWKGNPKWSVSAKLNLAALTPRFLNESLIVIFGSSTQSFRMAACYAVGKRPQSYQNHVTKCRKSPGPKEGSNISNSWVLYTTFPHRLEPFT